MKKAKEVLPSLPISIVVNSSIVSLVAISTQEQVKNFESEQPEHNLKPRRLLIYERP